MSTQAQTTTHRRLISLTALAMTGALSLLASAPTGEACVCELTDPLDRSQQSLKVRTFIFVSFE